MTRSLKTRLSAMMFLEYAVPGATLPILSLYLKNFLHFEPYQVGLVMAMPAVAATVAPLVASHVADRYMSAERMLVLCHVCSAAVMLVLSRLSTFPAFLSVYFVYGLCFTPTFGLTNAVALHHTPDARREFGGIRMWGTIGWVVVAWAFGYGWLSGAGEGVSRIPDALLLSAAGSVVLAAYALTFTPAQHGAADSKPASYLDVLRVFARPSLVLLTITTFLNSICHQFYYFGMSPYMSQNGFADKHIMPVMSIGQMTEVLLLGLLGWCLVRLGMKRAMIIAVLAQSLRYTIFAIGGSHVLIAAGISLHGICYAFYFTTAYLYLDQHSTRETRAGAQQVLTVMIAGFGTLAGFVLAGYTAQFFTIGESGLIDYQKFWLVPVVLSLAIALSLALGFREEATGERA